MKIINKLNYIKSCFSFSNLLSALKIFFYSILKQNTRYPNYLLDFEKKVSNYFGTKYALSFANGTTACIALLYSLGVKKNSNIIISKLTFPSVISAILRIGASPVFLDFDRNLQIKVNIDKARVANCDFFLITHAYGFPQNLERIKSILNLNKNIILIEDISHAQGSIINDKMAGTLGKGSFMSMQGDKAINAGEGGAVLTNNEDVYNRLIYLSHLNRKTSNSKRLNLLSKVGFIGKGRMNPLGAVTALSDIKNLNKRNKAISIKIKILYDNLKKVDNIYVPEIDNYNNLGGFHYGIPFFCDSEISLKNLKTKFKIIKYNWPILDANENFNDPIKFLELIYSEDPKIENVFEKSNDIRDDLYFFDLKDILNLTAGNIQKKLNIIIKHEN